MDESINVKNTAQLAVFVWCINSEFITIEKLVELVLLKGSATGKGILDVFLACTSKILHLKKLVSVTTDGAPAMVGSNNGFCSFWKSMSKKLVISMLFLASIVLFIKIVYVQNWLDLQVVVNAVKFIFSCAWNYQHLQFIQAEINSQCNNLYSFSLFNIFLCICFNKQIYKPTLKQSVQNKKLYTTHI